MPFGARVMTVPVPPSAIRGLDLKLATGENHMAKKAAVKKAAAKPAKKAAKKKK